MHPNPVLKKLGLTDKDRAVIIHTDDIGMCQASVTAYADLMEFGLVSSGAAMVPCPWFLEAARICREHPNYDMGVHLTLTSEWKTYRWGPISTRDPKSGLIDEQGYFYNDTPPAQEHADAAAAITELKAQIERAIAAGIKPTHADTHMGTLAASKFIPGYIELGMAFRTPIMMFRLNEIGWRLAGLDGPTAKMAAGLVEQIESAGMPLLDNMFQMNLDQPENRLEQVKAALKKLKPGVTHFIIHPSADTPELRAICHDWPCRVADYMTFMDERLRDFIKDSGLHIIGYRDLQNLMPEASK
jgi:chitin disaccharide deacetylase